MRTVSPDGTFLLDVPDDCRQETEEGFDERLASFWRADEPMLLQVSSALADTEDPPRAIDLLEERLVREDPSVARIVPLGPAACPDWAADNPPASPAATEAATPPGSK